MRATIILALLGSSLSAVHVTALDVTCHLLDTAEKFIEKVDFTVASDDKLKCAVTDGADTQVRDLCREACKKISTCAGFLLGPRETCVGSCCGDGTECVTNCEFCPGCKVTCPLPGQEDKFKEWRAEGDKKAARGAGTCNRPTTGSSSLATGLEDTVPRVGAVNGDPHFSAIGNQQNFEFQGVSGLPFAILTEPRSQLNALFHNLGREGTETFVKSIGFIHVDGVTASVDSGYETCDVDALEGAKPFTITIRDELVNLEQVTEGAKQGTWTLYNNKTSGVSIKYEVTEDGEQKVIIQTNELRYTTNMGRVACHLDTQVAVFDTQLLSAGFMDGILGQSASWQSEDGSDAVEGDETDYMVPELLDPKFGRSLFGIEIDSIVARKARKLLSRAEPVTFATKMGSLRITLPATMGITSLH